MSHSVPSDSSLNDWVFPTGIDLVDFDRRDLPIYASPRSLWAQAGSDASLSGTAVDAVYDSEGETHLASLPLIEEPREIVTPGNDPLVGLTNLSDGVLPGCEPQNAFETTAHDTLYDFSSVGGHALTPMPDGAYGGLHGGLGWDLARPEWFYDHHI